MLNSTRTEIRVSRQTSKSFVEKCFANWRKKKSVKIHDVRECRKDDNKNKGL